VILGRILAFVGSGFFVLYGFAFAIAPFELAGLVTGGTPATSSGLIDMRSTYGGMSIAMGIVLALLAQRDNTLRTSIVALLVVMVAMATTRVAGFVIDGLPNSVMYIYLALESITGGLCLAWLTTNDPGDA
jgi:hypothetical protein